MVVVAPDIVIEFGPLRMDILVPATKLAGAGFPDVEPMIISPSFNGVDMEGTPEVLVVSTPLFAVGIWAIVVELEPIRIELLLSGPVIDGTPVPLVVNTP